MIFGEILDHAGLLGEYCAGAVGRVFWGLLKCDERGLSCGLSRSMKWLMCPWKLPCTFFSAESPHWQEGLVRVAGD
jgi:hypothetical protein